jgi:hypothetical protein
MKNPKLASGFFLSVHHSAPPLIGDGLVTPHRQNRRA